MKHTQRQISVICVMTAVHWAFVGSVTAQVDLAELQAQLVNLSGPDYVTTRGIALSLPSAEFALLLTQLESASAVSQEQLLADVLRTRRENQPAAAEFDARLEESLSNPGKSRSMRPSYTAWWPRDRFEIDPLAFEAILKLDLPDSLQNSFSTKINGSNSANIDRILLLARLGRGSCSGLADAAAGRPDEQARITPILVDLYKSWREQGRLVDTISPILVRFGGQLQLQALHEMVAFEEQVLPAQGLVPWSDATLESDTLAADTQEREARRALNLAVRQQKPQPVIDGLRAAHEASLEQQRLIWRRQAAKVMWDQLQSAVTTLEAQLNPPPQP